MKPYSNDWREKIIKAYQNKAGSLRAIAARFSVSLNFVWLLLERFRATGRVDPKPHGGGQKAKIRGKDLEMLRQLVEENSDATRQALQDLLRYKTGIEVTEATLCRTRQRLKLTRKKKPCHATERDKDEAIQKEREEYKKQMPEMKAEKLVFIDEAGVNLSRARTEARAPKGERAQGDKPLKKGKNVTVVGALRMAGRPAALVLEGAIDGEAFKTFIEKIGVPTLQPGDIVLIDNRSSHKVEGVEEAINAVGAKVQYLPRYSPDLSPIELGWSKIKEGLRGVAARTVRALKKGIEKALKRLTPSDAKGWFKHCGYCIE